MIIKTSAVILADGTVMLRRTDEHGEVTVSPIPVIPDEPAQDVHERVRRLVALRLRVPLERITPTTRLADLRSDMTASDVTDLILDLEMGCAMRLDLRDEHVLRATGARRLAEVPALATIDMLVAAVHAAKV